MWKNVNKINSLGSDSIKNVFNRNVLRKIMIWFINTILFKKKKFMKWEIKYKLTYLKIILWETKGITRLKIIPLKLLP